MCVCVCARVCVCVCMCVCESCASVEGLLDGFELSILHLLVCQSVCVELRALFTVCV